VCLWRLGRTNDERILRIDCLKTDFFHAPAYPTYLFYNPYNEPKEVRFETGPTPVSLYDATRHTFLTKRATSRATLSLPPDTATLMVLAPAEGTVSRLADKLLINAVVVDYHTGAASGAWDFHVGEKGRTAGGNRSSPNPARLR
jgi:hypothetical protein